ncbi:MAG: ferrous iron transporter B, partial [Candidatus Dadabacteria bacterium]
EKIDNFLLNKWSGTVFFLLIMFLLFQAVFFAAQPINDLLASWLDALSGLGKGSSNPLVKLVFEGIVGGVGNVLLFIPQITILFFLIGILEESGYLTRASHLIDQPLRLVGLSGSSFIPLLSSFACAVPGIMATRVIRSKAQRLATILTAPFMTCSARLPVYTLLIAAVLPVLPVSNKPFTGSLILFSLYILGILAAVVTALFLKFTLLKKEKSSVQPYILELPPLHLPSIKVILRQTKDRVLAFVKNAGTIILACSILIWFLASFPQGFDKEKGIKGGIEKSYAALIGKKVESAIKPLGLNWEMGLGLVGAFVAREVFVSTLATLYSVEEKRGGALPSLLRKKALRNEGITVASFFSLMVFFALACQCTSTLAICWAETGSLGWPIFLFSYTLSLAYLLSFITYKISSYFLF